MDSIAKMTSSSLDWSIQSALSCLYPPFEATAPTVLSQLFRTIDARYQGDALQCFLDYLIPSKHILESVQQAACAEYSDVLFQCEGWPLCLRDRVVIQLAPINPLLLRPGDFYLQVEPFGEQSARIVLKSLLVQEDILAQEDLVLLAGCRAQEGPAVEETPIPETSYPCIFTEAWLREINEGRHGNQLHQCVLSSDQGIVKVPWGEVINPEFLDRPKTNIVSKASCTTAVLIKLDSSEDEPNSQLPVNMSFSKTPETETMILPAKNGAAVSHQLVKSSNKFVKREQMKPVSNPVGKPVGWVSPNTCESRSSQELEGDYVDLLDFSKEKDALGFKISVIPSHTVSFKGHIYFPLSKEASTPCVETAALIDEHCVPCSRSNQFSEDPQKGSESKGRHRQSYLAAIKNPVSFEKANTIVPLEEAWPGLGEAEPGYEAQEVDLGIDSLSNSSVQGLSQLKQNPMQSYPDSVEQDQSLVQNNMNTVHLSMNTALPSISTSEHSRHFLTEKPLECLQKTVPEDNGVNVNRQHFLNEQESHQMWTNVHKHLPKMGLRALPDHRSHRQETGAYKCQGVGKERQIEQSVYSLAPPYKSLQQPTGQRHSLISHPQKSLNMLQEQNSQDEQRPKCENKQCGENPVLALKGLAKRKPKARSTSSVSESARECSQEDRPSSRSRTDVCPEIIPIVPGVRDQRSKKCTTFGLVSPKLDRRKAAKNDLLTTGSVEQFPALQNGSVLQSSSTQLQNLSPEHGSQITALSRDPIIKNVLQIGVICLPGSRDRAGRAVLEVHGGKNGWTFPLLTPVVLCKLVLYLYSIPRRQVRDLGLTVIINSRNNPIPSVLYKALLMVQEQVPRAVHSILLLVEKDQSPRADRPSGLQMDIITSVKALHKCVDGQQLTSELGGSFPYNHTDWLQFYQKLFLFEMDLQGAALLLQRAIRKLDSNKKTDTAEDVRRCSQEQKSAMKQVLEDTHMVKLQRDGGAILARMRKEECRFAQSEDYRDSMEAVMCLYNQVEEGVHTLVMRSNQSLQHLDHLLLLRQTEEQLNKIREWCEEETGRWQKDLKPAEETREILEQRLTDIHTVLTEAKERKEKAKSLKKYVERNIQGTCYPETEIFHIHMTKFETYLADFILQAEQRKSDLEAFIHLFHFCEQAFTLTKECSHYLEHLERGWNPEMAYIDKLKSFQERFKAFSPERFEEEKSNAMTKKPQRVVRVWSEACSLTQEVKQRLEKKLLELDENQMLQRFPKSDEIILKNDEVSLQSSSRSTFSLDNIKVQAQQCEAHRQTQSQDKQARDESVNKQKESTLVNLLPDKLIKFPREHHSEADLRNVDLFSGKESNRALGRSHSEGSCMRNFSPVLTGPPLSIFQKISTSKPNVLLADREFVSDHQDSFCPDFSNIKLEWIQMDIRDQPRVTLDDHDSQISRQESFCSSVSSPRQGWMKEEKSSRIYRDDRNSGYPIRDLITPDRFMDTSDYNFASELENSSNLLKLQHIMEELLQTEREYVKALGYVMEHYFPELERQDVPQDLRGQRGSIFGNLEKLKEFHQHHFLKDLELCLRHPFRVGLCFLRHKESFGLYALYSKNKPRSDYLLINHGKEFFKQKQQLLGDKMDLSSYLLKPVQRISKYSLLLQDMLQECDTTSRKAPERAELQAALEVIQFQLRHGNNLLAMDDIQECDVNLKEQGQLIRQDEFLVFFRKKKYYRHIFLFQDLILFSKTKKTDFGNDIYIYKQSFKTSDIGMTHNCGDSGMCFEIWFRRRKSQDTYTLQARSYEVKKDWTIDLERILWDQAIHNRKIRMQERVFMGIGCKPFMDIKPSEAAICDRAINCALTGRDYKVFSGLSDPERGFPVQRPNSSGSASCVSSCSHSSSSSSSGRGSVSPVGYHVGLSTKIVSVSDHGRFSNPGEHDLNQENVRQNQLVDSSESSVESISGFSSSGYSFQSVIGREHEVHSLELSDTGLGKQYPHKMEGNQQHEDTFSKPQTQNRDQPPKAQGSNHMGKSTEV